MKNNIAFKYIISIFLSFPILGMQDQQDAAVTKIGAILDNLEYETELHKLRDELGKIKTAHDMLMINSQYKEKNLEQKNQELSRELHSITIQRDTLQHLNEQLESQKSLEIVQLKENFRLQDNEKNQRIEEMRVTLAKIPNDIRHLEQAIQHTQEKKYTEQLQTQISKALNPIIHERDKLILQRDQLIFHRKILAAFLLISLTYLRYVLRYCDK